MDSAPRIVFVSSSRDMTHWAALAASVVRDFAAQHGLVDLEVRDYRDIDPADINHAETWQDVVAAPSRVPTALTLVLLGERMGTPLPAAFRLKDDIYQRLQRAGYDWVDVPGVGNAVSLQDDRAPLTGTLFEFFDAFLPRFDGSAPPPLRVIFKGTHTAGEEPDFGNGEFRAQIEASMDSPMRKRQERKEYDQQLDWLYLFWSKVYGLQQHAQLFCRDEDMFVAELQRALTSEFLSSDGSAITAGVDTERIELPGLAPYDMDTAPFFFGRSAQLAELARRALHPHTGRRLVPVTGDSGVGKSSLLRAGLLNSVRSAARRRQGWRAAFLSLSDRPATTSPLLFLAESLADPAALPELDNVDVLRERLDGTEPAEAATRLMNLLARVHPVQPAGHGSLRLLLIVDQYDLALDGARIDSVEAPMWRAFVDVIAALGGGLLEREEVQHLEDSAARLAESLPTTVVLGVQRNRLDALEAELRPGDLIFPLPRLVDETGLREVISQTFIRLGLRVEPQALERLCREAVSIAAETAGSILPLVSVTLSALHAHWRDSRGPNATRPEDRLRDANYDIDGQDVLQFGRLGAAIERLGEQAWLAASAADGTLAGALQRLPLTTLRQQAESGEIAARDVALSQLMRRLVVVSSDPAEPDRLAGVPDAALDELTRPLAQALGQHRLLSQHEDGSWWLVHLSVLRNWQRAANWRAAELTAFETEATLRTEYVHWKEEVEANEPGAERWIPTSPRRVVPIVDWLGLRGVEDDPALVEFAKAGLVGAAARDAVAAGRAVRLAAWFDDARWCISVLEAAGSHAATAADGWNSDGTGSPLLSGCWHHNTDLARILLEYGARPAPSPTSGWTALHSAAVQGSMDLLELFIGAGADLDAQNVEGWTPLMSAASNGHARVVERLIAAGARLDNVPTSSGWSALMFAVFYEQAEVVRLLLAAGAALEETAARGMTALMIAAQLEDDIILDELLHAGAEMEHRSDDGSTALLWAVRTGRVRSVGRLLREGASIEAFDDYERTSLHWAAELGNRDVLRELLEAGADVAALDKGRRGAVHYACSGGHSQVVDLLTARGAAIDGQSQQGESPLHIACRRGDLELVETLLGAGANRKLRDNAGMSPLAIAVARQNMSIATMLLDPGQSASSIRIDRLSALAFVAGTAQPDLIDWLLEHGAEPCAGAGHVQPLTRAAQDGNPDAIRALAAAGAPIDDLDEHGMSDLMYASLFGHAEAVQALVELGADPNRAGVGGWSPLMFAALRDWSPRPSNRVETTLILRSAGAHGSDQATANPLRVDTAPELSESPDSDGIHASFDSAAFVPDPIKLELSVNDRAEMLLFHNESFASPVVAIGLDADTRKLELLFESNLRREFGIPVEIRFLLYAIESREALVVRIDEQTREPLGGQYLPILHTRNGRCTEVGIRAVMLSCGEDIIQLQGLTLRVRPAHQGVVTEVHYNLLSGTLSLQSADGTVRPLMNLPEIWQPNVIKSTQVLVEQDDESVEVPLRLRVEALPAELQAPLSAIYVKVPE